jgi:hypothetical protein
VFYVHIFLEVPRSPLLVNQTVPFGYLPSLLVRDLRLLISAPASRSKKTAA